MGEVILETGEVLNVYFVCATAVQSQLFIFADLFLCIYTYETSKSEEEIIFACNAKLRDSKTESGQSSVPV